MAAQSFLEGAVIDTIIPQASDANLEEALSDARQIGSGDDASMLPTVTQRSLLFFDELVPVYVVLRLTNCSEDILKTQLSRLDILVEAYALSGVDDGNESDAKQRVKQMIYSGVVNEKEDPLVVVDEVDEENSVSNYVYVIWKTEAFLSKKEDYDHVKSMDA
ncbi:hypothetical protein KEM54_000844 [Ascosphaera aggregata]|nr:hypothetical protein KEM54_000844 [Ascosphaera aggregata]